MARRRQTSGAGRGWRGWHGGRIGQPHGGGRADHPTSGGQREPARAVFGIGTRPRGLLPNARRRACRPPGRGPGRRPHLPAHGQLRASMPTWSVACMPAAAGTSAAAATSNRSSTPSVVISIPRCRCTDGEGPAAVVGPAGRPLAVCLQSALLRGRAADCTAGRRRGRAVGRVHASAAAGCGTACGLPAAMLCRPASPPGRLHDDRPPAADHVRRPGALSTRRRPGRVAARRRCESLPERMTLLVPDSRA